MPEGHDATIEVCNNMSFVLYTQILKQSVLKPASPGITLIRRRIRSVTDVLWSIVSFTNLLASEVRYQQT